MSFVDEIKIKAKSGKGGNGIVSWLRMRNLAMGGPAGGDGGKGGDVYFKAVRNLSRLADYTSNPKFAAEKGGDGRKFSREGKDGDDLFIEVPIGSQITELETQNKFSLLNDGEVVKVLVGGKGGYGNEHFKSSINTTPMEQTDGKPNEEGEFYVELQLLVDLGFVGLPSAGKSSLMNEITKSHAKVGDYPFTTLEPSLGAFHGNVLADIPGLIEGASSGKGLGHKFLRHIKRTKTITHLVSFEYENMIEEYKKIRLELEKYSPELMDKKEVIVLSKSDLVEEEFAEKMKKKFEKEFDKPVFILSIINDEQMKEFTSFLSKFLSN
jgi:GTP-binding protein